MLRALQPADYHGCILESNPATFIQCYSPDYFITHLISPRPGLSALPEIHWPPLGKIQGPYARHSANYALWRGKAIESDDSMQRATISYAIMWNIYFHMSSQCPVPCSHMHRIIKFAAQTDKTHYSLFIIRISWPIGAHTRKQINFSNYPFAGSCYYFSVATNWFFLLLWFCCRWRCCS